MNRKLNHRHGGLRLDGYDGSAIDVNIRQDHLHLYICQEAWNTDEAIQAQVELDEAEVLLLMEKCTQFLILRTNLDFP